MSPRQIILVLAGFGLVATLVFMIIWSTDETLQIETVQENLSLPETSESLLSPGEDTQGSSLEDPPLYFLELLPDDCPTECERYLEKPEALGYCRSVCGLTGGEEAPSPASLVTESVQSDLELKKEAEEKLDLSLCAKIRDAALRKACEVRVTEDVLE